MPLSEFLRRASANLESGQQKPTTAPNDQSSIPGNDVVELVWENGQITMQGQPSRPKTSQFINDFPLQNPRTKDKYIGNATSSRIGKVGSMESLLNDVSNAVPSGELDFNQDDDMVNWLNYPIDDNLQQDYPQLLPEVSGITMNEQSNQNSFASLDRRNSYNQRIGSSHTVPMHNGTRLEHSNGTNLSSSRTSLLSSFSSLPPQTSLPTLGSGVSDVMSYNNSKIEGGILRDSQGQPSAGSCPSMKMPKQNISLPNGASSLSNFSFLSRHAAHAKAGQHNASAMATSTLSAKEKIEHKEKNYAEIGSNPVESPFLPSSTSYEKNGFHNQPSIDSSKADLRPSGAQALEESHPSEADALSRNDYSKTDLPVHQVIGASSSKGVQDGERTIEPVVASSSVCSGSSADRGSSDQTHNLKRKGCDNEDSEYRSEMQDIEEESMDGKKAAPARGGAGSKRSRAAEVHNLSERRRRDRINERMRALQELIPNCNKADKASMLDEAIEYLKTLQLQVQIMSMGAGLCMPPMMFPAGMQHLHAAHMPHFPPMGVGMGMGMGYGMGMLDMNGGAPGCPIFPVPTMQRTHFPSPSVPGPTNFQGLAGSTLPIFRLPGQGHPMSVPRAPLAPMPGRPPASSSVNVNAARTGLHGDVPCASPSSNVKDTMLDKSTQLKQNADVSTSKNETPNQMHKTNEGFDKSNQSTLPQKSNQVPDDSSCADVKLSTGNSVPSLEAGCG